VKKTLVTSASALFDLICSLAQSRGGSAAAVVVARRGKNACISLLLRPAARDFPTLANLVLTPSSGLEAELRHAASVVLYQPGEHPAHRGEIHPWTIDGPRQQVSQRVPVRGHALSLAQRLSNQPTSPKR
jgi:hypothetical protein